MLKIVQSPDPLLNKVCQPCDPGDKSLKKLAKQMEKVIIRLLDNWLKHRQQSQER